MDRSLLAEKLKVVLATAYSFALKAQNYHWNVTGPHFIEYHEFFQGIYEQVHADIDAYAEHIRIQGSFAPGSLARFSEMTKISDELNIPNAATMMGKLKDDNEKMLYLLSSLHTVASEMKAVGLSSFLEEKIAYHEKLDWMLKSVIQKSS